MRACVVQQSAFHNQVADVNACQRLNEEDLVDRLVKTSVNFSVSKLLEEKTCGSRVKNVCNS